MFNHEYDILEIRLNELYDYVDHFVLVECNETQRGDPKPFYFDLAKERFSKFLHKIIHVKVENRIQTANLWVRENYQRNQIGRGLRGCKYEDIIMISDVDEILRGASMEQIVREARYHGLVACQLDLFVYYLNGLVGQWNGPVVATFQTYLRMKSQGLRNMRNDLYTITDAGWHFSSVGSVKEIVQKQDSNLHGSEKPYSAESIALAKDHIPCIPIDDQFPKYVIDHQEQWIAKDFLQTESTTTREQIGFQIRK